MSRSPRRWWARTGAGAGAGAAAGGGAGGAGAGGEAGATGASSGNGLTATGEALVAAAAAAAGGDADGEGEMEEGEVVGGGGGSVEAAVGGGAGAVVSGGAAAAGVGGGGAAGGDACGRALDLANAGKWGLGARTIMACRKWQHTSYRKVGGWHADSVFSSWQHGRCGNTWEQVPADGSRWKWRTHEPVTRLHLRCWWCLCRIRVWALSRYSMCPARSEWVSLGVAWCSVNRRLSVATGW